jgi:hypothetical protein
MKSIGNKKVKGNYTEAQKRRIYWLCSRLNLDLTDPELRHDLIFDWTNGRASGFSDLMFIDAMEIIRYLETMFVKRERENKHATGDENGGRDKSTPVQNERDNWDSKVKGCFRAVFEWLRLRGTEIENQQKRIDYAKSIICRAAGVKNINQCTEEMLVRIYNEFCRKQKVIREMENAVEIEKQNLTI